MPHALAMADIQEEQDDLLIQQALDPESNLDFSRDLEPGEKADDAVDYEDLSDGDLAEDEDVHPKQSFSVENLDSNVGTFEDMALPAQEEEDLPELTNGSGAEGDGFDDLFGDVPSSPVDIGDGQTATHNGVQPDGMNMSFDFEDSGQFADSSQNLPDAPFSTEQKESSVSNQPIFRPVNFAPKDVVLSKEQLLQQQLFAMSGSGQGSSEYPPAPPENQEELLASLWPKYERETIPRFMDLLPPKQARYVGKIPLKVPKPVHPTKVSLELAPDQEKNFKINTTSNKRNREDYEQQGIIPIESVVSSHSSGDENVDIESDYENEPVGGITWQDLQVLCEDWEIYSPPSSPNLSQVVKQELPTGDQDDIFRDMDEDWETQRDGHSAKKRKTAPFEANIFATPQFSLPSLTNPEYTTSKIAKTVMLDLNDPLLLIDTTRSDASRPSATADFSRGKRVAFSKGLSQRYNISNDEAYDLLKENHQSKVRSTLGNLVVSHSLPAMRLQWPYYKTKLEKQEARSFHRPAMFFQRGEPVVFSKPRVVKKKHTKGKETQAIFETTKDLTLGDNSSVLLLEYSEEYPAMMSNFGMGNRVINYYRRKNMEDTQRPKLDIGETAVLLPQDKSPFSLFGHIDAGQITPTLHNGMYRAPIFKQEAKPTDFLVIRNTTGVEGSTWYIRNIENIQVVGQEFPSVDVPGPHSRKVTTASKNRLKMLSYRRLRRNKPHRITVGEITQHFTDSTDMQNRQKMKEFLQFSKEAKEWEMRAGEAIPDEDAIRSMVKPEDVCLLESMQVGQQHLQDAGFSKGDDESDDDESKEDQSIEQQLAPWYTSRNFLQAAQGKAMLQLHGEGDPTGRGEAFSFIKTSMKGGFKAVGESVEDKLDAKKLKELGGHSYNVARQQKSYEESIRRIWDGQKLSLSSTIEQSDTEMDQDDNETPDDMFGRVATPRSEMQTPAPFRRRDDETGSQFSKFSTDSQSGKVLRITRDVRDKYGQIEQVQEIIRDSRVIRQYLKRRHTKEAEATKLSDVKPTGDADQDRRNQQRLKKELARLERNKERRIARDKQKGIHVEGPAASPGSPKSPTAPMTTKSTGTQRKCANCGQVGHIKTNKKLCPLLNGTMRQEDSFGGSAFAAPVL